MSIPFALSTATTVRMGHLLGAQRAESALKSARVSIAAGFLIMGVTAGSVYLFGEYLAYIFSTDPDVIYRVQLLAPIVAGFQVVFGLQGCAQGVLRATGRQAELAG
jgi:multidrug resistance protein, MATE family